MFVAGTAFVSILLMVPAIISSTLPLGMVAARYFANLFVFFPLFVALIRLGVLRGRFAGMALVSLLAGASVVSGIVSGNVVWNKRPLAVSLRGIPELASFLSRHGLAFGFGPYCPRRPMRSRGSPMGVRRSIQSDSIIAKPVSFRRARRPCRPGTPAPGSRQRPRRCS